MSASMPLSQQDEALAFSSFSPAAFSLRSSTFLHSPAVMLESRAPTRGSTQPRTPLVSLLGNR